MAAGMVGPPAIEERAGEAESAAAESRLRVLLVEDNPGDARLLQEALRRARQRAARLTPVIDLAHASTLREAITLLAGQTFDAALLDLSLPDARGIETFRLLHAAAPALPVVVLTGLSDDELAAQAVAEGAQDYLVKGRGDGEVIVRAVRYAVARGRAESEREARLREQLALREVEHSWRSVQQLVEALPYPVWSGLPDGRCDFLSRQWMEFTGTRWEDVEGWGWLDQIHPDDRERAAAVWTTAVTARAVYDTEYRLRRHDGTYHWFHVRGVPLFEDSDALVKWFGVAVDVEERRQIEHALREETEALETINRLGQQIAAELDQETLVQAVTDAATELTGAQFGSFFYNVVNDAGESLTLYTISGVPKEAFSRFPMPRNTKVFDPTFRGDGVVRVHDITKDPRYGQNAPYHGMPAGHLPVVSYLAVPVISRSGEVMGGLFFGHPEPGVFTAKDERIVVGLAAQAATSLDNARLYQQAQLAIRSRDDFLAAASHDLKNPLAAIQGTAQVLQRSLERRGEVPPDRLQNGLRAIAQSTAQMNTQLSELLDVARARLGRGLVLERRPTDLVALVTRAVHAFGQATERHRLILDVPPAETGADAARVQGEWDAPRLERVVDNLISNAIKYSPSGGDIQLTVQCEGEHAVLRVADRGIGIPAGDLPLVFERFSRARNVVGRIGGSGIGLTATQQIVQAHGGTIGVESEEGKGSTFTVRLPLRPPESETLGFSSSAETPEPTGAAEAAGD